MNDKICCEECDGQGYVIIDISLSITERCPICDGNGEVNNY